MNGSRRVSTVLAGILLVSALVLAGCKEAAREAEVTSALVWSSVGGPMAGAEIPLGENSVLCHNFAVAGVAQTELFVNGAFANRVANPNPAATKFNAELTFQADTPGAYRLECVVIDQGGLTARSKEVTVFVTGEVPTPPPTVEIPTATPTSTEVPPTSTPLPPTGTAVPPTATSIPPTSTRIPPTSTPLPTATLPLVRIVSFEVSKSQITAGECVTFHFQVEGATAIYFDGEGATSPDSRDRCPTATREFELRAEGHGGPVTARLTVVVQPGDTTGPSIQRVAHTPALFYYHESYPCSPSQVTISAYVTDPSGVNAVKVVYRVVQGQRVGQWQSKSMPQAQTDTYSQTIGGSDLELSLDPPVQCGQLRGSRYYGSPTRSSSFQCAQAIICAGKLEYYVQAFDAVGNRSDSSPIRSVDFQYCEAPRLM